MRCAVLLTLVAAACGSSPPPAPVFPTPRQVIDLSHTFDDKTLYWPTSPTTFTRESLSYGMTPTGFFYSAGQFASPEHGGTHLDAPIHFAKEGVSADAIPVSRLIGPAAVIDISKRAAKDPDALLSRDDISGFEKRHGAIAAGTIVLVRTGWSARWPDRKRYLGDDKPGDATRLHFPGVSQEAARALVERQIAAVGIDTASIDHGPSRDFIAHQVLAAAQVPIFENVAALDRVPQRGAFVVALPMKIAQGSGGPLRIVAFLP
jgi:kynurenine formamidase